MVLIIICFQADGTINISDLDFIRKELNDAGIRLNTQAPRIQIKMRNRGGIHFTYKGDQLMDADEVKSLMNDLKIRNAGVYFAEHNITPEQLIDIVYGNRIYT
ncbi:unnamed protein product, partial [marine sediment metagenome]